MEIDFDAINREVEAGYISVQRHPVADLRIFNYTQRAQWENHWTPETRACRGLIVDGKNHIVARPFPKFFNLDQVPVIGDTIPAEPFEVFEKLDGSLGILYYEPIGGWQIATRGSFTSDQAKLGQKLFDKIIGGQVNREITLLFEIIHPDNRIVVDYGRRAELVLLAGVLNRSGDEVPYAFLKTMGYPVAKRFDGLNDLAAITAMQEDNAEGFVIRFQSGYRVKVKFEEYKRLHKLLTGVTPRYIWDILRNGQSLDPLFERTPDEFHTWARSPSPAP